MKRELEIKRNFSLWKHPIKAYMWWKDRHKRLLLTIMINRQWDNGGRDEFYKMRDDLWLYGTAIMDKKGKRVDPLKFTKTNNKKRMTPQKLADDLHSFYIEQSDLSDKFTELEVERIRFCNTHKEEYKSDTATERAFYATDKGIEYVRTELRLKDLTRRISALKTLLRNAENVARGNY